MDKDDNNDDPSYSSSLKPLIVALLVLLPFILYFTTGSYRYSNHPMMVSFQSSSTFTTWVAERS